jgi:hypothetical protein
VPKGQKLCHLSINGKKTSIRNRERQHEDSKSVVANLPTPNGSTFSSFWLTLVSVEVKSGSNNSLEQPSLSNMLNFSLLLWKYKGLME